MHVESLFQIVDPIVEPVFRRHSIEIGEVLMLHATKEFHHCVAKVGRGVGATRGVGAGMSEAVRVSVRTGLEEVPSSPARPSPSSPARPSPAIHRGRPRIRKLTQYFDWAFLLEP